MKQGGFLIQMWRGRDEERRSDFRTRRCTHTMRCGPNEKIKRAVGSHLRACARKIQMWRGRELIFGGGLAGTESIALGRATAWCRTCLLLTLTWSVRGGILGVASQSFLLCAFVPSFIAFPFAFTKRKNSFILINRQLKTKQKNYVFINCHGNNFFFKKITLGRPIFFHLPLDIIKLNNLPKSQKYYHPQFYIQ